MSDFIWSTEIMDLALLVAAAVVVAVLWVHFTAKASSRRIDEELRRGAILNGVQHLPAESQKIYTTSEKPWKVVHYYRAPKGGFFVYRAAFGLLGWRGRNFTPSPRKK